MDKKSLKKQAVISKIATKKDASKNAGAFEIYDIYKKAMDIIDQANIATGKKVVLKSGIGSTLNFEINRYAISSTISQEI